MPCAARALPAWPGHCLHPEVTASATCGRGSAWGGLPRIFLTSGPRSCKVLESGGLSPRAGPDTVTLGQSLHLSEPPSPHLPWEVGDLGDVTSVSGALSPRTPHTCISLHLSSGGSWVFFCSCSQELCGGQMMNMPVVTLRGWAAPWRPLLMLPCGWASPGRHQFLPRLHPPAALPHGLGVWSSRSPSRDPSLFRNYN